MKKMIRNTMLRAMAVLLPVAAGCAGSEEILDLRGKAKASEARAQSGTAVLRAGFEDAGTPGSRTSLEMNDTGTEARVLWTSGDAIRVLGRMGPNTFYESSFTTEAGGSTYTDFGCSDWNPGGNVFQYWAFYPASSFQGLNLASGLGVLIPSLQTAVPGSFAEGLNLSYAFSSSLSDYFIFRNIPALVKFRLSGDAVGEIATIKFSANTPIAGEGVLRRLTGDNPYIDFTMYLDMLDEPATSTVTLGKPAGGSFQKGVDYYIAAGPCTTDGFSMVFSDDSGNTVTKTSSKTLTLNRSRIADLGTLTVNDLGGDPLVKRHMKRIHNSPKPLDLVVVPDGFTAGQRVQFEQLAAAGIDFMFNTEPFKSYKDYFNVYFIWAASNQTGGSVTDGHGNVIEYHDTFFGTQWCSNDAYSDMTTNADKVFSYVSAHCPEIMKGQLSIRDVPVMILVNDARYGGICLYDPYGQALAIVPYTFSGGGIRWDYMNRMPNSNNPVTSNHNSSWHTRTASDLPEEETYNIGDWRNTVLHEYGGHGFGRLVDEYWYDQNYWYASEGPFEEHSWPVPSALNVSGYYNSVPWQEILNKQAAGQLTNPKTVGKFQGGAGSIFNVWRSERSSCMINNNQYFSAWQRVLIAKRIVEKAGETFNLNTHLAHEAANPVPYRNSNATTTRAPIRSMPPLPPPVLMEFGSQTRVPGSAGPPAPTFP